MDTSILCTNGALVVCLAIGFAAGSILSLVDPRFDDFVAGRMVRLLGAVIGSRKGRYRITVEGPAFAGQWGFRSRHLEKLSRAAANAKGAAN